MESKGKNNVPNTIVLPSGTDDWTIPEAVLQNRYFVKIEKTLVDSLNELDKRMKNNGDHRLFSKKPLRPFGGTLVDAGFVGIWSRNGRPVITITPGNYWNMSIRHKYIGQFDMTTSLNTLGLSSCQVGQSEAAVVMDPSNRVFIIKNGGFVSYGSEGIFKVIAIVDTLDLGDKSAVYEPVTPGNPGKGRILGWRYDVRTVVEKSNVTVATFFNVPANNVLILQRADELLLLKAGQHVITNPNTSFRGFFSLGERQTTFKTQPAYTVEGVPVVLNVNLRYRIHDPIALTANYDDAFQALGNPAQTAVNSVVSRLSYQQFMRAKNVSGDIPDINTAPWLDSFKSECLRDLREQATLYGITVESFDVLDRELQGKLGKDLEQQSEQVLRNQVQATQIELQNHIATETQRGKLEIAKVDADQKKTQADAEYYVNTKTSDSEAYKIMKRAEAEADASKRKTEQESKNTIILAKAEVEASQLKTEQDAKNVILIAKGKCTEIKIVSEAYTNVTDSHARKMQLSVFEVEKIKSLPEKTIYFGATDSSGIQDVVVNGLGAATGLAMGNNLMKMK